MFSESILWPPGVGKTFTSLVAATSTASPVTPPNAQQCRRRCICFSGRRRRQSLPGPRHLCPGASHCAAAPSPGSQIPAQVQPSCATREEEWARFHVVDCIPITA